MVRAVMDTNVLVSAVLNPHGTPAAVVRAAGDAYTLVSTAEIVAEWLRVIAYDRVVRRLRRMNREEEARATVARLGCIADLVPPERLPVVRVIKDDPSDDLFLATALGGGARVLVSGDRRHVLPLRHYAGIRIIDAATFARELGLPGHARGPVSVHEAVARWGDGEAALVREARRWARTRRRATRAKGLQGKPLAALVPVERLEQLRRVARKGLLEFLESRGESDLTEDEAMKLALEAQRRVRAQARRAGRRK